MDADKLRSELIRRVETGELQPSEAEAEAAEKGCGPLARRAPAEEFDPMQLEDWSLPMALAWIAWRSPDEVRNWWDAYSQRCFHWVGCPDEWLDNALSTKDPDKDQGWLLVSWGQVTVCLLQMTELYRRIQGDVDAPTKSIDQSMGELWKMLRRGCVRATGVDCASGERVDIPLDDWQDLEATQEGETDVLRSMARYPHGPRFTDVLIEAKSIRQLWLPKFEAQYSDILLIAPDGDGYMSLFSAAHWIATRGGAETAAPDFESWRSAYGALLEKVVAGKIEIIGTNNAGPPASIEGHVFADCQIAYPFEDTDDELMLGNELVLVSRPYIDEDHWRSGFDDSLCNCKGPCWTRIRALKDDVLALWPFISDKASYRSGNPGRPSSKEIVLAEYRVRCERGEMGTSQRSDAKKLQQFLREKHPNAPPASWQAIEAYIREERRRKMSAEADSKQ